MVIFMLEILFLVVFFQPKLSFCHPSIRNRCVAFMIRHNFKRSFHLSGRSLQLLQSLIGLFFCFFGKTMLSQCACKSAILLIEVGCTRSYLEVENKCILKKGSNKFSSRFSTILHLFVLVGCIKYQ